jgi:hypothetical protein
MSSSLPPSTAQQQVLEDMNLVAQVLMYMGANDAECLAALLVSHFWSTAFTR